MHPIKVWDTLTLRHVSSFDLPSWVVSISFSPSDPLLAVGCGSANWHSNRNYLGYKQKPGEVYILSFPKLKEVKSFQLGNMVHQVLYSRDGKFFATSFFSTSSGDVSIWSVADWQKLRQINGPDARRILIATSAANNSFFYLERPFINQPFYRLRRVRPEQKNQPNELVVSFDWHPQAAIDSIRLFRKDDQFIFHEGGPVRIINIENGKEDTPEALVKATSPLCRGFTVSEDGKWLAGWVMRPGGLGTVPHGQNWVVLWDLPNHKQLAAWPWPENRVRLTSIALSPDKKFLAVGNGKVRSSQGKQQGGEVVLYDLTKLLDR